MTIKGEINPLLLEFDGKPLWCIYGPTSFPQVLLCQVVEGNIWGYSVWKRVPGFRTIGSSLESWRLGQDAHFFASQERAMAYLSTLITPHKRALA